MNNLHINNTMYRYDALIKAIDFFTQRFSSEQLAQYSFDFANEILTLNKSALFILQGEEFQLKNKRLYSFLDYSIKNTNKLQKIANFHGSIICNNFNSYFEQTDVKYLDMNIIIPLIIDDLLFGFIISNGKAIGDFDEDDYTMAISLMRLFNNSLENSNNFQELKDKNKQLDKKIFNLFAMHQSAKSLLSQLGLEELTNVAIDVFSEITCSKVTTFGIVDSISDKLRISGYRNVEKFSNYVTELEIKDTINLNTEQIVLDVEKDIEIIKEMFVNWEEFYVLEAKYIVLLVRDKLIGLVTLGEPINQIEYDDSIFELIMSLASFTYIALENTMLFEKIKKQKKIIESKYNMLVKFNSLINNINQCTSIEELCKITLKTLNISFGMQKVFIAFKENEEYKIMYSIDDIALNRRFKTNERWINTFDGDLIYDFSSKSIDDYLGKELSCIFDDSTGIIVAPIVEKVFDPEKTHEIAAYLVILKTSNNLQQEEILLIDLITKNISPIMYHMKALKEHKEKYVPNNKQLFYEAICKKIADRDKYNIDFHLYYNKLLKNPFAEIDLSAYKDYEHYLIENYMFIISYYELQIKGFKKMSSINTFEDIINYNMNSSS